MTEPKTAEDRVQVTPRMKLYRAIEAAVSPITLHYTSRREAERCRDQLFKAIDTALQSMHDDTREATVRECCAAVSDNCPECNGDGEIDRGDGHNDDCPHCLVAKAAIYRETGVTP